MGQILGVVSTAFKENERRAAIHPDHIAAIPEDLRSRMLFEQGYGERFGVSDAEIAPLVKGLVPRQALFEQSDIVVLPKPTEADFPFFKEGQTIWGWPHCVQGPAITQVAIDKKLTFIAWEEMHHWDGDSFHLHVFHINNELAGYCSVLHALQLAGLTGDYGPYKKAAVIGFGSVGRGAVHALQGQGYPDITLFTSRPAYAVRAPIPGLKHWQYDLSADGNGDCDVILSEQRMPMPEALGHFDIIVNAILQDPLRPQMFVRTSELGALRNRALIVDVSCDEGMGFEFARPTSFEAPSFKVNDKGVTYYAVDHSPTYLWDTATHSISEALIPFLPIVMAGPAGWDDDNTITKAIEIRDGVIVNKKILAFQRRGASYPHERT